MAGFSLRSFTVPGIPPGECPQSLPQRGGRAEAEILLQRSGVGVCHRDIPGLHRHQLLVRPEVVAVREDTCRNEFLLEDGHEVEEVLRMAVPDVIDFVRGYRESVCPGTPLRSMPHNSDHPLYDIVDVGEVPHAVPVVEYLYVLPGHELVRESEIP